MAAEEADPFESIIDECHISSSQEEILANSKFALEDHVFSGDIDEWLAKRTAELEKELEDKNYVEFVIFCERCGGRQYLGLRRHRTLEPRDTGEYVAFCSRCGARDYLGIGRDRKRCYDENFNLELEVGKCCNCTQEEENPLKVDPPWKKLRPSGPQSSNLKGSGSEKIVIDSEDIDTPATATNTDTKTMGLGVGRKDGLDKTTDDNGNGKSKADDTNGNGMSKPDDDGHGKCKIDHTNGNGKGVDTNGNGNGYGDGKSKGDARIKNLFQVLGILAAEARIGTAHTDTDTNMDIFETAKRRGIKFPVSRFRLRDQ